MLLVAGCGPKPAPVSNPPPAEQAGPDQALRRYLDAVRAGRYAEAYGLMSAGYRRDHDLAAFEKALGEHKDEVEAATARLAAGGATVELHAEAKYGDGEVLPLVVEAGAWRIAADPLDFYPQGTPQEALRSFVRAVERKRYDVVYRFVPVKFKKALGVGELRARWEGDKRAELAEQLAEVRAHLGDPLDVTGDSARLPLGEKRETRLVREEGVWRVEALR
jgi:hypothetical protein